MEAVNSV